MANRWANSGNSGWLYFLGSKITADGDCSHEIKRHLLLGTEKAMATHSSTLAWKIPWTEEPGRLQSMGSLRVGHDWATSLSFHFHALEKEMATHSSVLTWRIPGTEEPGGLRSMGLHRVGHNWSDAAAAISSSRGSSWSRDRTRVSCITGGFFTTEPPGKPLV